eukprot:4669426-Pyramimonas_sp.AAC.1
MKGRPRGLMGPWLAAGMCIGIKEEHAAEALTQSICADLDLRQAHGNSLQLSVGGRGLLARERPRAGGEPGEPAL